jgi:hypothetical protein
VFFSGPQPGARHDFSVFKERIPIYEKYLQKTPEEIIKTSLMDSEPRWAMVADKGYIGPCGNIRMIVPERKKHHSQRTKKINNVRVHIERFFGRLKFLFARLTYYNLKTENLMIDFEICVQLTNIHIIGSPLLDGDEIYYQKLLSLMMHTAASAREKKKEIQKKYIEKKKQRANSIQNIMEYMEYDNSEHTTETKESTEFLEGEDEEASEEIVSTKKSGDILDVRSKKKTFWESANECVIQEENTGMHIF